MKNSTRKAIAEIREKLGLKRINPRRLYMVDDGAYSWIGDRADLTSADARLLKRVDFEGRRPDLAGKPQISAEDYSDACGRCRAIAGTHSSGALWENLPESWRDGSALGPISPL